MAPRGAQRGLVVFKHFQHAQLLLAQLLLFWDIRWASYRLFVIIIYCWVTLKLVFQSSWKKRVNLRLLQSGLLLRSQLESVHLIPLWVGHCASYRLPRTCHHVSCLKQYKLTLLEVYIVRDQNFDAFQSTGNFKLAFLKEILDLSLGVFLQCSYLRVKVCLSGWVLYFVHPSLVEECLCSWYECTVVEKYRMIQHSINLVLNCSLRLICCHLEQEEVLFDVFHTSCDILEVFHPW